MQERATGLQEEILFKRPNLDYSSNTSMNHNLGKGLGIKAIRLLNGLVPGVWMSEGKIVLKRLG